MKIHERPWGEFELLIDTPSYKVKRLILNPHQAISYQYHNKRKEYWVIVSGKGIIIQDNSELDLIPDTFWIIPAGSEHRARAGEDGLVIIEIQTGECDEDDVVRLQDDYGRY